MCDSKDCRSTATSGATGFVIPELRFASEWFKCSTCGYAVRIRLPEDVKTISCKNPDVSCGGTMYRV